MFGQALTQSPKALKYPTSLNKKMSMIVDPRTRRDTRHQSSSCGVLFSDNAGTVSRSQASLAMILPYSEDAKNLECPPYGRKMCRCSCACLQRTLGRPKRHKTRGIMVCLHSKLRVPENLHHKVVGMSLEPERRTDSRGAGTGSSVERFTTHDDCIARTAGPSPDADSRRSHLGFSRSTLK